MHSLPPAVQGLSNCALADFQNTHPVGAPVFSGMTASQLNDLLTETRNPNVHTRPPPKKPKKVEPVSPFNNQHLNVFLRCYLRLTPASPVSTEALSSAIDFSVSSDCELAHRIQCQSIKAFLRELEGKTFQSQANGSSGPDDPPLTLSHIRRQLPAPMQKMALPQFVASPLHFKFVVDTSAAGESQIKYFSAQITIKNEGSNSISTQILQRVSIVDGVVVPTESSNSTVPGSGSSAGGTPQRPTSSNTSGPKETDFQVFMDRNSVPKKGQCTVLLSLIAQPSAVFRHLTETVVLLINGLVPLIATFAVINPSLPLFGTPFPSALTIPVTHSPLSIFCAPVALELLRTVFIEQGGLESKNILHVLDTPLFGSVNRASLLEAAEARVVLEELGLLDVLHASPVLRTSGAGTFEGIDALPGTPAGSPPGGVAASSGNTDDAIILPPNTAVAALLPSTNTVRFKVPMSVAHISPAGAFQLILAWIAECPTPLVDRAILSCDPFVFLETLPPAVQGTYVWCIDICCLLLVNQRRVQHHRTTSQQLLAEVDPLSADSRDTRGSGASEASKGGASSTINSGNNATTLTAVGGSGSISVRVLAIAFATVIAETFRAGSPAGTSTGTLGPSPRSPTRMQEAGAGQPQSQPHLFRSAAQDAALKAEKLQIAQHLTTAFVYWVCRYIDCYSLKV
jgi:hypothetical protein